MSAQICSFQVATGEAQRLDKFLVGCCPELSRARLQSLIRDGQVSVDGHPALKASLILVPGQQITLTLPAPTAVGLQPEAIPLAVVFENADLLVINKPAGMVVHPAAGHATGTLVHAALAHVPDLEGIGGELRPGVVHRLDKDTSGLILMAKNDRAHRWLQDQFRQRTVQKFYLALVDGAPPTPTGRIEAPIGRDPAHRKKMAITPPQKGREAVTEYRVLESFPAWTLVEAHLLTGRTHQIRLHLAFLECPIVGDVIYGRKHPSLKINRHFLHAARLTICLPGETRPVTFEAPLPPELQSVLDELRGSHYQSPKFPQRSP
ncbi:MAG TPA: RluA family pseudouridine synthase [Anaerolineaceae bacterium]|nr:RluA family pseudouridine synthase [Anaerolineaceae bacterium]